MENRQLNLSEIFMIQAILYLLVWLWNDYAATILSLSFAAIALFIVIIAFISELIEPSKVPRKYFYIMLISAFTPIIIGSFFMILKKGALDWMIFKLWNKFLISLIRCHIFDIPNDAPIIIVGHFFPININYFYSFVDILTPLDFKIIFL